MGKKRVVDGQDPPKHLSCRRCRSRKIKCVLNFPCTNCIKAGVECVQTTTDKRSKRPAADYVSELETHISHLQSVWEKVKKAKGKEREELIKAITDFQDGPMREEYSPKSDIVSQNNDDENIKIDIKNGIGSGGGSRRSDSAVAVYGPTSVYHNDLITKPLQQKLRHDHSTINTLNKDQDILHCVKTFFTWQYPDHNMFLFREAFLIDFFNPTKDSLYCSKALILSICALGARMLEIDRIYERSHSFYTEAKELLLTKLDHPSITSLQSFLLLAFYDICNGSNSSGWMLSGNAFRMGYDIGFQLNPQVWFMKSKDGNELSTLDLAIRSRIYWGSYMADHFISLLLGRPSLLKMSEATIPETDYLPDLEWIDEFMYLDPQNKDKVKQDHSNISLPLKNIIKLINISDSMLSDIFTRSESEMDTEHNAHNADDLDIGSRLEKLSLYNTKIMEWKKGLPKDLAWDREHLDETGDNPIMLCIRYYYYILILCLNRPFVAVSKPSKQKNSSTLLPSHICEEAIDDLHKVIDKFAKTHGLRKASIFIVYCSILAISVLLLTNTSKQLVNNKKKKLDFFMDVLKGCSKTWNLAEKSYKLIQIKLHSLEEEEEESSNITPVATPSMKYTPEIKIKSEFPNTPNFLAPSPRGLNRRTSIAFLNDYNNNNHNHNHDHHNNMNNNNNELNSHSLYNLDIPEEQTSGIPAAAFDEKLMKTTSSLDIDENLDFFGGPPVLMTSDLFNEDWESLFPDYMFNPNN